jgi:hypothetical protein
MAEPIAVLTREYVPQELHESAFIKPWLDKPWDKTVGAEFFKKLDGAESLIGKRLAIPDHKTATPEEMEKFFEQFRPDKADDYEIPLDKDAKPSDDFLKAVRAAFHAGKISKVQASGFLKTMDEFGREQRKALGQENARKAQEFDTLAKTMLGEQNKAVMERVRGLIKQYAPSAAAQNLDKITDEQVVVMGSIIDAIHKKYATEDDLNGGTGSTGGGTGGTTAAEKRREMRTLMGTKPYANWQDPAHASTNATVKQLAKEIAALEKK